MGLITLPLFGVYNSPQMESAAIEVLRSGAIASGQNTAKFEMKFGELIGQRNIVATNDVSNAILIALRLAGIGPGDTVLATPFSCMSTNSPIAMIGAKPAWVDTDPLTATIDLDSLNRAASKSCKALILYHVSGYPGPLAEVQAICRDRGLMLIEDCDNALLAKYDGSNVGSWGDFSVYSFYPNRQINTTEGGALACRDAEIAERGARLRRYGINSKEFRTPDGEINPESDIPEIGWPALLNNLCSAIGLSQIASVSDRIERARSIARRYSRAFSTGGVVVPVSPLRSSEPSYWTYLIRSSQSDRLLRHLKGRGVGCSRLHYLTNRYSGFGTATDDLPGSIELMNTIVAIPCGWWLSDSDVDFIIESVLDFSSNVARASLISNSRSNIHC